MFNNLGVCFAQNYPWQFLQVLFVWRVRTVKNPIESPMWVGKPSNDCVESGELRQLVAVAGPLANGMAVALNLVQESQFAEAEGCNPPLSAIQRAHLVAMCSVAAQLLAECANDAGDALIRNGTRQR